MPWKLKYRIRNSALVLTRDAWQFWATALVLLIALFAPATWACTPEEAFRYGGVGLQLAGLGTVAYGIRETRRRFRRPSLPGSLRTWLARLKNAVLLPPITAHGRVVLGELRATGTATVSMTPSVTSQTVDERLSVVEEAQKEIRRQITQLTEVSTQAVNDLRAALAGETAARESAQREINSLIEDQAAGGIHLEVMGLVWLLFGTLDSSLSIEIAKLLPGYPWLW